MKEVEKIKQFVKSAEGRRWLARLVLPAVAVLALVTLMDLYNIWAGLTSYNLVRRSVAAFALGTLLFGPAVLWRTRAQAIYLGVVSLLLGVLFLANAVYSSYAGGFLSASSLSYFWQASDTGGSIQQLFQAKFLVFLLPGVAFLAVGLFSKRLGDWQWQGLGRKSALVVVAGVVLLTGLGSGYVLYKEQKQYGDLKRLAGLTFDSQELVRKIGIINYNFVDLANYLRKKRTLTAEEEQFVKDHRAEQVTVSGPNAATGILAGRSVIFLQMESIQEFLFGLQINGQEVTPNLNKLAAESRHYTSFNYDIGPGTSSDAEFATFNSLLPLSNQSVVFDYPANAYLAYPKELKAQGYTTEAFHADSRNFWNRANTFPVFGFGEYQAEESYEPGKVIGYGLNDRDFLKQTAGKLAQLKQPFYAHVITLSSHSPFELPADEQKLDLSGVQLTKVEKDYLEAAHYTDIAIGDFMAELEKEGLSDKVAIMAMGDHEGFIFNGNDRNFAKVLGLDGFDDMSSQRAHTIPFLIHAPGTALDGTVDDRPASQIDIYPTLVNLLAMKKPDTVLGVDLLGEQMPTVVQRTRGAGPSIGMVRRGDLSYFASGLGVGGPVCYRGNDKVSIAECNELRDFATTRAILSDDVITGNRVDLLSTSAK